MARVQIPEHAEAGRSRAYMELTRSELEITLDLLRTAVRELQGQAAAQTAAQAQSQQQNPSVAAQQQRLGQLDISAAQGASTARPSEPGGNSQALGSGARGAGAQPGRGQGSGASRALPAGGLAGGPTSSGQSVGVPGQQNAMGTGVPAGRNVSAPGGPLRVQADRGIGPSGGAQNLTVPMALDHLQSPTGGVRAQAGAGHPLPAAGSQSQSHLGMPAGSTTGPQQRGTNAGGAGQVAAQLLRPGGLPAQHPPQQQQHQQPAAVRRPAATANGAMPLPGSRPGSSAGPMTASHVAPPGAVHFAAAAAAGAATAAATSALPTGQPRGGLPGRGPATAAAAAAAPSLPAGNLGLARLPESASPWSRSHMTAALEHSRDPVAAVAYGAALRGLPGGDGHAGWLISSSRNLLNLWECSPAGNAAETPLQVMHSQAVESCMEALALDLGSGVLLAACASPAAAPPSIALHSLSPDDFFAFKGKIRIPSSGIPTTPRQPGGPTLCHVSSLQPLGGPLRDSLAATAGGDVLVYELSAASHAPLVTTPPKAFWRAHDVPITCLHQSLFACALFTGGNDGFVRLWDLKMKPSAPVRQYVHHRYVTGVEMLDANTMASSSADGVLQLWDIRASTTNTPLRSMSPDGKAIVAMAASPLRDSLAVATFKGLYCIEMAGQLDSTAVLAPLTPLPPVGPCLDVKWNERTGEVYASGRDGVISVYSRSL